MDSSVDFRRFMSKQSGTFNGFEHYNASFVFCPNEYLDYCVNAFDRGVVRAVGYVLYQTLRWIDDDGQPIQQDVTTPYNKLIAEAGVGRSSIRTALAMGVGARFVECIRPANRKRKNEDAVQGQYRVSWSEGEADSFDGFRSVGCKTMVPHQFFTTVLPFETLSVIRVVAAVIRNTVGYETKVGRRKLVPLSYSQLQRITRLSRGVLASGIRTAIDRGYIEAVEQGCFSPDQEQQKSTVYRIRWTSAAASTGRATQDQSENRTSNSSKSEPGNQSDIRTTKKENSKQPFKQQAAADNNKSIQLLTEQGIGKAKAVEVARSVSEDQIRKQIEWMPHRSIRSNPAGYLVAACQNDYAEPDALVRKRKGESRSNANHSAHEAEARAAELKQFTKRRDALLQIWAKQSVDDRERWQELAIRRANDESVKNSIRFASLDDERTHRCILDEMALELGLQTTKDHSASAACT